MTPFDTLWLDTETYCEVPIKHGTYIYAANATVDIASYAIDDGPVHVIDFTLGDPHDVWILQDLLKNARTIIAHNAMFDRNVLRLGNMKIDTPIEKWRCCMVKGLLHGLPGGLDKLCNILNVPTDLAKHKEGRSLMMLFCKPLGKNRKLRRATRETHPAEWDRYLAYAGNDISSMREVWKRLPRWNYGEDGGGLLERDLWHLDQKINDRGLCIDLPLVRAAIRATDDEQARLKDQVSEHTAGEVTAATQRDRMLAFIFAEYGVGMATLTKAAVTKMLEDESIDPMLRELLTLRAQASRSSTAKYAAFERGCSSDGRLRGMLQFSGASRTRRDAGRTVQLQNLASRGLLPEDEIALGIEALMAGAEDLVFDDVMQLTASTVRSVITAAPGKKLVVSDLANIEGRGLAWLAGEEWKLQAFREYDEGVGPDLYKLAYAKMFRIEPDAVNKAGRSIGKVMELACFSAETKVLTNNGVKAVSNSDLLWDGISWVRHRGVVERSARQTVNVDGINLTPEHLVLTGATWTPAQELAINASTLSRALAIGSASLPSSASPSARGVGVRSCGPSALVVHRNDGSISTTSGKGRAQGVMPVLKPPQPSGARSTTGMQISSPTEGIVLACLEESLRASTDAITKTIRGFLTTGVEGSKYSRNGARTGGGSWPTLRSLMGGISQTWTLIASTLTKATSPVISGSSLAKQTASTSEQSSSYLNGSESLRPVFDILNTGPLNRFTVVSDSGYLLVHNCGYEGGIGAFMTFALGYGMDLDEMANIAWDTLPQDTVAEAADFIVWQADQGRTFPLSERATIVCEVFKRLWRMAHPMTVQLWREAKDGFATATRKPGVTFTYRGLKFRRDGAWLRIQLPSGRALCYPHPEVEDGQCSYMGVNQFTRKWERIKTHGGKLVENCVQSLSRDVLFDRLPAVEEAGYPILMRVHDEVITEPDDTDAFSVEELSAILSVAPSWAHGMPLAAAGFESQRYKKD